MILADTSVWIDQINGRVTPQTDRLKTSLKLDEVLMGDLILFEILMGARSNKAADHALRQLSSLPFQALGGIEIAEAAAGHFRILRGHCVTIRTGIDMLIGTWCILNGVALLHNDRDYDPMERHLGLKTVAMPRP